MRRPRSRETTPLRGVHPYRWRSGRLDILDQRDLPGKIRHIPCRTAADVDRCIRAMAVRGAPAIGNVAAFALALEARRTARSERERIRRLERSATRLAGARPTAVNLFWALDRMARIWRGGARPLPARMEREARAIDAEDRASCLRIGEAGAALLPRNATVLTHCNAGALATAAHGTALGVIRSAHRRGRLRRVYVDETRPYLQGARLTAWELAREAIPHTLLTDNMAGHILKTEKVDAVVVGADRIAANGDAANKIGTYALAVLARHHGVPFYVAAPFSTVDPGTPSGEGIPIEERPAREVLAFHGVPIAPRGTPARHPAFDVTPASLITALVTDRGVLHPPFADALRPA